MRLFVAVLVIFALAVTAQADTWDDWYRSLDARAGYLYNLKTKEADPYATAVLGGYKAAAFELGVDFDIDPDTEERGLTGLVGAVTFKVTDLSKHGVGFSWAKYFEVNVGPFARYDFQNHEFSGGIMASIIGVTEDDGALERHAKR